MSKVKRKNKHKRKSIKKKNKKENMPGINSTCTSLSKRNVSCNWVNFITSTGSKRKLFNVKKVPENEKKLCTRRPINPVITKVLALDCEMVSDFDDQNMLARVSVVNFNLECVYDKYVKPTTKVGDFRTRYSGIREKDLENGEDFELVRSEVRKLLYNKILVGHALGNDFKVLKFGHHGQLIRDTSTYSYFKEMAETNYPSLKKLAKMFLGENVQEGEHNSIDDARTCMKLYKKFRREWETSLIKGISKDKQNQQPPENS